jgi:elongation factor Ts
MDVRKALTESDGDVKKAKAWIEKKGLKRAEEKADRTTEAGHVFSYVHFNGRMGSLVKLACETDFVAKTEDFQTIGKEIAMQVASMKPDSVEELLKQDYLRDGSKTIEGLIKSLSGKTGENIKIVAIASL